jgi:hypothetical protein
LAPPKRALRIGAGPPAPHYLILLIIFLVWIRYFSLNRKPLISAIDYMVFGESRENHFLNPSVFVGFPLIFLISALLYTTVTNHSAIASRIIS